ncbi:MAG: hypothetical protein ABH851_06915 [Methanobacteriota archaeon]
MCAHKQRQKELIPSKRSASQARSQLYNAASEANCDMEMSKLLASVKYNPNLEDELLPVLTEASKLSPPAFKVVVDMLEFSSEEKKLQQALPHMPKAGPDLNRQIATLRQLRRLGLPLTGNTITLDVGHLAGWDIDLTHYDPLIGRKNPGIAREMYYHVLAYNSAVEANEIVGTSGRLAPFDLNLAFVALKSHPEPLSNIFQADFPPVSELTPPEDLDGFLLQLPKFTQASINQMDDRKKRGIWRSRVEAIGRTPKIDRQKMMF